MNLIKIIFEDENLLILDKPAGITVNNSETTHDDYTLQDWIENNFQFYSLSNGLSKTDFNARAGIVHRIDKETSGILVVAKNESAFVNLQLQFKERKVEKTYIALVHGKMDVEQGEIVVPVGRLPWNRKRFGVLAGGKEAYTFYKIIEKFKDPYTLLELNPKTGRTHQIRVHLKYINHPIFGDYLYAGRKTSRDDRKILDRVFLHAASIGFFDPKTGKKVEFNSQLPKELENTLAYIRS